MKMQWPITKLTFVILLFLYLPIVSIKKKKLIEAVNVILYFLVWR